MLFNYIKLSLRLLARNPFFAVLNIAGLSVGFAVFFVLWQYSSEELKSDQQWKDWQRIARVGVLWHWADDGKNWESERYGVTGGPLAPDLANDFPEIESYTRILYQSQFNENLAGLGREIVMSRELPNQTSITLSEDKIVMADSNFFTIFSIPFVGGNPSKALINSNSMAISSSIAKKYFGTANPIDHTVTLNNRPFVITGVFEDLPSNSHLNFDIILSNVTTRNNWLIMSGAPNMISYLKMKSTPNWKSFESKLNDPKVIERYFGETLIFFAPIKIDLLIQPLPEIRFSPMWKGDEFAPRSIGLLYIFQSIGLVVLLLAIVNYISLNASRTSRRLKEIGARKVSGARLRDFAGQFLIESTVVFLVAVGLAFTLLQGIKTPLRETLQISPVEFSPLMIVFFVSVVVISVCITAGYPAYLSAINKPQSLFGKNAVQGDSKFTVLSTLQFSAAIVLTIWVFIIYAQVSFITSRNLGFSKEGVIVVEPPAIRSGNFESDLKAFSERLSSIPQISQTTRCNTVMGDEVVAFLVRRPGSNVPVGLDTNGGVDEKFLPFYDITLLAGRNFLSSDRGNEIILSDGALPRLGFQSPEDAIGATIEISTEGEMDQSWIPVTVIGVIKGYRLRPMLKFSSDHDNKADGGIALTYQSYLLKRITPQKIVMRVEQVDLDKVIQNVSHAFHELFPGNVFHWYFLDENINRHYISQKVLRNQVLAFTGIAIGIACLGLLGMITNKVAEKTKEIGIRKVLGAQLHQIAHVLLHTTVKQIIMATAIGIPVSYYLTQGYLENFSERMEIVWWHFTIPVLILVLIMSGTIATVVWKAAKSNPVDALKYE